MARAWCCCTTKSSGPARSAASAGPGSGVAVKVRFASYSRRLSFAMPNSKGTRLFAGASGYSFKEWKGIFYPEKIKPEEMLPFYCGKLSTVEINNTFYRMPKVSVLESWAKTAPDGFRFAIKASRRITHMARLKAESSVESVEYLYKNLQALGDRRGPVLFQLPPNMKMNRARLEEFLALLPDDHRAAFEFRNDEWFDNVIYDALRAKGLALVLSERED